MLYQFIDMLCDSVNPLLLIATLAAAGRAFFLRRTRLVGWLMGSLIFGLAVTYGLFFLDRSLGLWAGFGGDYSTHTTFALAAALPLWLFVGFRRSLMVLLLVYAVLMVIQRYHSALDITTSAGAFGMLALPMLVLAGRWGPSRGGSRA